MLSRPLLRTVFVQCGSTPPLSCTCPGEAAYTFIIHAEFGDLMLFQSEGSNQPKQSETPVRRGVGGWLISTAEWTDCSAHVLHSKLALWPLHSGVFWKLIATVTPFSSFSFLTRGRNQNAFRRQFLNSLEHPQFPQTWLWWLIDTVTVTINKTKPEHCCYEALQLNKVRYDRQIYLAAV